MKSRFLVRIEQHGRVNYLAVQGRLNALHLADAYAHQGPAQQVLVLDATGRVLWKTRHDNAVLPVACCTVKETSPMKFHAESGPAMPRRLKAIAFDVDAASLISLREALPEWEIEEINGSCVSSFRCEWDPGAVNLLVVGVREDVGETLGLGRFLAFCTSYSRDSHAGPAAPLRPRGGRLAQARQVDAPLLVLVSPGQEDFVRAALEAGAHHCLILPICATDVIDLLAHAGDGNQPSRRTLNLDFAQHEDPWRDDGGQG